MIINSNSAVPYDSLDKPVVEKNFSAVKLFSAILFLGINSTTLDASCHRANLTTYLVVIIIIHFQSIIMQIFIKNW